MNKLLSLPKAVIGFLDNAVISTQLRTTTWLILGALLFQLLSTLLTTRIASFLALLGLFTRLVPTVLITTGALPNPELLAIQPGKTTPVIPTADDEGTPTPGASGLALLILGIKVSHPLGIFAPGVKQTGDYFQMLVQDLNEHPTEHGWLGGSVVTGQAAPGESGHLSLIGYFKTMQDLHAFAHAARHREAWDWWNRNVKSMPHVGVYHEAYDVPAGHWEAVYLQTPKLGLGQAKVEMKEGGWRDVLVDARKGVFRSSAGRMGRSTGKTYSGDPYNTD